LITPEEFDALHAELAKDAEPAKEIPQGGWVVTENGSLGHRQPGQDTWISLFYKTVDGAKVRSDYFYPTNQPWKLAKHQGFTLPKFAGLLPELCKRLNVSATSGTDPEIFVQDRWGDILPAWSFLPNKAEAYKLPRWENEKVFRDSGPLSAEVKANSVAYWDGFQAEFSTPGVNCLDILCAEVFHQLKALQAKMPLGCKLSPESTLPVTQLVLDKASEEHVALGCKPSLNAYGHKGICVENCRDLRHRFAGGHIHFGLDEQFKAPEQLIAAVKMIDAVMGVASVSLLPKESPIRRRYYGLAGEYRTPSHGLEYRVLSNYWLRSPKLFMLTFTLARGAMRLGLRDFRKDYQASDAEVTECINNHDVDLACKLIDRNRVIYEALLNAYCNADARGVDYTLAMFKGGVDNYLPSQDIPANWHLDQPTYGYANKELSGRWGLHLASI
jgi:hypothetical protein